MRKSVFVGVMIHLLGDFLRRQRSSSNSSGSPIQLSLGLKIPISRIEFRRKSAITLPICGIAHLPSYMYYLIREKIRICVDEHAGPRSMVKFEFIKEPSTSAQRSTDFMANQGYELGLSTVNNEHCCRILIRSNAMNS